MYSGSRGAVTVMAPQWQVERIEASLSVVAMLSRAVTAQEKTYCIVCKYQLSSTGYSEVTPHSYMTGRRGNKLGSKYSRDCRLN